MRPVKIVCDRCGTEIIGNPKKIFIEETERESGDFILSRPFETSKMDFCDNCIGELAKQIMSKDELSKEDKKPTERKKIDRGKLMALKNAGWKAKDIADEMGISEGTVNNTISKMKKERS